MINNLALILNYGFPVLLLILAYIIGSRIEKRHMKNIQQREAEYRNMPVVSFDTMPADWQADACSMVGGSVVISLDYFKRVIAGLRGLIGGRITTYEPLLERARREAILRMIEDARSSGYDAIFNVRLETSRLANSTGDGKGTAGVEMLAFGTAVRLKSRFANG